MEKLKPDAVVGALNWRYATKKFDPGRRIDAATWEALEQSLLLAPSSFGLQPWKFVVVEDAGKRRELVAKSWGQSQVADASHLVVFAVKSPLDATDVRRHIERTAEVHGTPVESLAGFEKVVAGFLGKPPYPLDLREWGSRQVYIALGNFMLAAALLGVDTCPMEGLDPNGVFHGRRVSGGLPRGGRRVGGPGEGAFSSRRRDRPRLRKTTPSNSEISIRLNRR
jgi:nitroreductase